MALVTCGECGGKVSIEAPSCPHCGIVLKDDDAAKKERRQNTRNQKHLWEFLSGLAVLAVIVAITLITINWISSEQEKERQARANRTCSASVAHEPGRQAIAVAAFLAFFLLLRRTR